MTGQLVFMLLFFFVFFCRSSVVQADGVGAGGPEGGGNVGSDATALWRAAQRRLPRLPVHRARPPGDRHARVFQSQDPVS